MHIMMLSGRILKIKIAAWSTKYKIINWIFIEYDKTIISIIISYSFSIIATLIKPTFVTSL